MVSLHKVVLLDILFIEYIIQLFAVVYAENHRKSSMCILQQHADNILCKYALEVYIKNEQTLYSTQNFLTEKL